LIAVVVVLSTLAKCAMQVGIGVALVSVSIGHVGLFVVEVGISEHGPKPGSVMEEPSGNALSVAIEVGIEVAEDEEDRFAKDAMPVRIGVTLMPIFIGHVRVFAVEFGIPKHGPGLAGNRYSLG
jgi:hypothetical protein